MISKNNRYLPILLHLLVWTILLVFPYVLAPQDISIERIAAHSWFPILCYAIVFYINYFLLVEQYLFKKKHLVYFGVNVLMIAVFVFLIINVKDVLDTDPDAHRKVAPPKKFFIYFESLPFVVPVIFAVLLKTMDRWKRLESDRKEAQKMKLESDLQTLRYQIQPHFFFNSLNNIYAMVDTAPEGAKSAIHSLGKLMRYLLYETDVTKVTVSREMDFIQRYIELMRLRVPAGTIIDYELPLAAHDISIPPLLLISLIENAFKHGISATAQSEVHIKITIENGVLHARVENTSFPKQHDDKSGSGIGLSNLRRRLDLLFEPDEYVLKTETENGFFEVNLKLPVTKRNP
ncbi:sensor histidine kinase [Robertkochia solimangrovi]|uniref:sensor histidine kinase n=1 Tax=Robertkochia solimangrovi TaxID=2213046 RepID=UPI00117BEC65|nr:histidine kinase [Robertkochia solimangrovi]TRZ42151.1 histidine kinase [Robertkochia solimangrovi]